MDYLVIQQSKISGKGIYTKRNIPKGKRIGFIQGTMKKHKSSSKSDAQKIATWYGVSRTKWIDPGNSIFQFLNHSCNPNAAIIGTKTLVAMRNIRANEEITIDYSMTDGDELWEMSPCKCHQKNCRKTIRSIQYLQEKTVRRHLPFIPRYFKKLYNRTHPSVML